MDETLPASVAETHIGTVFFTGDLAYKVKKPVHNGFLDFRTRSAREQVCHREVELNRRFAPDVYLGVADVTGPNGELCDHLVVMRRMDPATRLSHLVRTGADVSGVLREVARRLAAWHSVAPRGPEISAAGTRDAVADRWAASFEQTREHGLPAAPEIERLAMRFLAGRAELFDHRIADGRVVDGHGDLIADDVFCLPDGPRILDCLEFDDELRYLDGLDDAAFLAMDLERLRAAGSARTFLDAYAEFSADPAPAALRHHYVAYRAFVRAKVACLRAAQGGADAAALARHFAEIALRHLRAGTVTMVLVGGLPGTGKSTLAGALADQLGWTLLSSDRIRKELAGISPQQSASAEYRAGIYSEEFTQRTYAKLTERAVALMKLGECVVLDASWTAQEQRRLALELAGDSHADVVALQCRAPAEITADRIRARVGDVSDADEQISLAMGAAQDPWPESTVVNTAAGLKATLEHALETVRPYGSEHLWPQVP
ncbi:MAG: AAA family ATPase [Streptosporangiaceae bacterium]